jgi:hypothetical protein
MNRPWSRNWSRRALLKNTITAVGLGAGVSLIPPSLFAQARAGARGRGAATPAPKGSSLVMLGTQGGPSVNLSRGKTASAVVVDGQPYLVDCGYGTLGGSFRPAFASPTSPVYS